MKKLLIPFIASFGLSLGLATGVVMVRTPKPIAVTRAGHVPAPTASLNATATKRGGVAPAGADSVSAASAGAAVASANGASTAGASTPGAGTVGAGTSAGAPAGSSPAPSSAAHGVGAQDKAEKANSPASTARAPNTKLASNASAAPRTVIPVVKPATDSLIGRRLAQVFAAMQPKDAARVLEQMDDNDVRAILGSLSSKQQAAILGAFPTQRAALILQATLRTASSGGVE